MRDVLGGFIDYLDRDGRSRGRESFTSWRDADGMRTLQVTCEIDGTDLVRHVVQTADAAFRPRDAYVRVAKAGRLQAAGWLCFDPAGVDVTLRSRDAPAVARRIELPRPALAFGSHPLIVDGWMAAGFDLQGPRVQPVRQAFVSSYEVDGAGTVDLLPIEFALEYLGPESVEVGAGRFVCHHFRYVLEGSAIVHPPYETWVTTDGHYTLVQARMGAPNHYRYELAAFGPNQRSMLRRSKP